MITIVVGAQYGGEGKGKVSAYLAWAEGVDVSCRCGGPNSSHTVVYHGSEFRLRMMPAAAVVKPKIDVYFGAGTLIHLDTLFTEIDQIGFKGRLFIDKNAGVVTDEIIAEQRSDPRYGDIGSTLTGTGLASALRASRKLALADQFPRCKPYLSDVSLLLLSDVSRKRRIIIEGHQGYGLSNYHGDYPYTSSRDCITSALLSELGLPPNFKKTRLRVVMAVKIFPTRNHAGNLGVELSPHDASVIGINEYGGGSWGIPSNRRRVAFFDPALVQRAAWANGATDIALTGADYLDRNVKGSRGILRSNEVKEFVADLESKGITPIRYVSTGPDTEDMVLTKNINREDLLSRLQ